MLSPCGIKILKENLNEQNQICQYPVFDPAPLRSIAGIKRPSSFRMMVSLWHLASPNPIWRHLNSVKKMYTHKTHTFTNMVSTKYFKVWNLASFQPCVGPELPFYVLHFFIWFGDHYTFHYAFIQFCFYLGIPVLTLVAGSTI